MTPTRIYTKTLYDLRGQMLAWSVGLAVLSAGNVLFFPSIRQIPGLVPFLESLPPVLRSFVGDVSAMVTLEGFLKVKLFDPLPLLLAVFGVAQGAQSITGELEHKSLDLLLAQPVRRWRVVVEKYLAFVTATLCLAVATSLGLFVSAFFIAGPLNPRYLLLATLNGLPLTWVFCALALCGSCGLSNTRYATILGSAVVVASYTFETFRLVSPALSSWKAFSLFAHQKAALALNGEVSLAPVALLLALAAVLVAAGVAFFARRDLRA